MLVIANLNVYTCTCVEINQYSIPCQHWCVATPQSQTYCTPTSVPVDQNHYIVKSTAHTFKAGILKPIEHTN